MQCLQHSMAEQAGQDEDSQKVVDSLWYSDREFLAKSCVTECMAIWQVLTHLSMCAILCVRKNTPVWVLGLSVNK